ncbi:MAG: hypothetical protein GQ569_00205 [Methylococcaceae bacterium]|nr:hypothetical protein [Methylococcaceae bacterium]
MTEIDDEIIYEPKGFLEEEPGRKSSMRAMSFIALLASVMFGLMTLMYAAGEAQQTGLFITFGFLLAAFAPKALQKFAETKI